MRKTKEQKQLIKIAQEEMKVRPFGSYEHKKAWFLEIFAERSIHDQLNFLYDAMNDFGLNKVGSEMVDIYNEHLKTVYDLVGKASYSEITVLNVRFYVDYLADLFLKSLRKKNV